MFIIPERDCLWYHLTHYHLYKLFLTWSTTTLFWCRFWNFIWIWPEMGKKIVFVWVPGHNLAADSAAKDAVVGDISVELIPFSDIKACTNKYMLELWQSEWDEFPKNKLHKVCPNLKEYIVCPQTNRKEDSLIARLSFFHHSLFTEGWGTRNVHWMWWTCNYRTHFTQIFRFY